MPDSLLTGRGDTKCLLSNNPVCINTFLQANTKGIIADPLLNFAGISEIEIAPLLKYFSTNDITHISAVRSYSATPYFIESAPNIKSKATVIANNLRPLMPLCWSQISLHPSFRFQPTEKIAALDSDGNPTTKLNFYINK